MDKGLLYQGRLYVPTDDSLKGELLAEAHNSPFSMHSGEGPEAEDSRLATTIRCVRVEMGERSYGFYYEVAQDSEGFLDDLGCVRKTHQGGTFYSRKAHVCEFAYNNRYQDTIGMSRFEALPLTFGRAIRSLVRWGEIGERKLVETELMELMNEAMQKIRARMLVAQSRQKSYVDVRRKDLEFEAGDKVFLKVVPMKGVLRFGKKGKLSLHFVGRFEILERVDFVAHCLALLPSLSAVHNVFHVSMLRKYLMDPSHMVDFEPLQLNENLSYEEKLAQIVAREVKVLRSKEVPMVKVL
ncbi:uncharacterized protein LOC120073662 [Benincasa hispida]|uniref:uncharacterized protein LOC120073662 n=1 Tax=Benincasa hispida TaxID=102211 RepID=UPI0019008BB1|nr:uncharacterized protein LOC120073662 [Benincasa hispida]